MDFWRLAGFRFSGEGFSGTANKNSTTNIDYKITTEKHISGGELILKNHISGDSFKFQVVDVDNILGYGVGVVLDTFADNWNVAEDRHIQTPVNIFYNWPAKILANLYIRIKYVSVGSVLDVEVKTNLYLYKKT